MHQFQYEIEDGNRKDLSPVRIGHDDAKFPGYSWRGYGTYSQLQDEVLLDVMVTSPSVYNMVLRYSNPNPTPIIGEITMESAGGGSLESGESDGAGTSLAHQVLLPPTGGQPSFVTVSGDKGIYASPFDLSPGQYTTAVKIPNTDTEAEDILVDYFVLVPREYYEPSILKQDVYEPCLAGEILPYCRHYSYPDLAAFPKTYSNNAERPGGGTDVYAWTDNPQILAELGTSKVASLAKWQPELVYPVDLQAPGKHVIAVVFFTPDGISLNGTTELAVSAQDSNGNGAEKSGKAYIFDCKLSTLCRQVVADEEGRVQEFDFASDKASVKLNYMSEDEDAASFGIDSIVAIPLEDWSLDLVTPNSECVRKDGECIRAVFPDAPDESALLPFTGSSSPESSERPKGIIDEDANLLYVDDSNSIVDIHGRVPKPGLYVLVAHYYQPDKPSNN
jgi:laminin alpha 3/5